MQYLPDGEQLLCNIIRTAVSSIVYPGGNKDLILGIIRARIDCKNLFKMDQYDIIALIVELYFSCRFLFKDLFDWEVILHG